MATHDTETRRIEAFYKIIRHLNDIECITGGLYDCGDIGVCLIFWYKKKWECAWYKLKRIDAAIGECPECQQNKERDMRFCAYCGRFLGEAE